MPKSDWIKNVAKSSENVEIEKSNIYKKETLDIIDPKAADKDLDKKIRPITLVMYSTKSNGDRSVKSTILAYWAKSLEKIAEKEIEAADAETYYNNISDQVKNIDNKIKEQKYEEAATESASLLEQMNPKVVQPEINPTIEKTDENNAQEYLTTIDIGDIVNVSGNLKKFQFKNSYLDSLYFRVTDKDFKSKFASLTPTMSYSTFTKAHIGRHDYVVSFYKEAKLDNNIPVGDIIWIERDGTNENWVMLGEEKDLNNSFPKICRRLTIFPDDIGLSINSKGELIKSSSVSMVFFDTPEEAAKWQDMTAKEDASSEAEPASSTEKLDKAMEELDTKPSKKEEKPFKSFQDYQEEKKEEATDDEKTYSSSSVVCEKCNHHGIADGKCLNCGHAQSEKTHTGKEPYYTDEGWHISKPIEESDQSIVHSNLKISKLDKTAEEMDMYFAMFNNHINDAFDKAKVDFITQFGQETWDKVIQPMQDKGIMSMFNKQPNEHTMWFAQRVQKYVNEKQSAPLVQKPYDKEDLGIGASIKKAATNVTYYKDVKEVCILHFDESTSRYCVEWTNGDWRTDLDEPAVSEYLKNDHLSEDQIDEVLEKTQKFGSAEIKKKETKDGFDIDVKKMKELEKVKEALLAKGFTKEAELVETLMKESFHPNFCQEHPEHDSYLCQACGKDLCNGCTPSKWMKIPGKEHEGNVCADCLKTMGQ